MIFAGSFLPKIIFSFALKGETINPASLFAIFDIIICLIFFELNLKYKSNSGNVLPILFINRKSLFLKKVFNSLIFFGFIKTKF